MWGDTGPQFAEPHLTINQMKQKSSLVGLVVENSVQSQRGTNRLAIGGNYIRTILTGLINAESALKLKLEQEKRRSNSSNLILQNFILHSVPAARFNRALEFPISGIATQTV
jgi:hypothetical protein